MISVLTNMCGPANPCANAGPPASRLAPASVASRIGRCMTEDFPDMSWQRRCLRHRRRKARLVDQRGRSAGLGGDDQANRRCARLRCIEPHGRHRSTLRQGWRGRQYRHSRCMCEAKYAQHAVMTWVIWLVLRWLSTVAVGCDMADRRASERIRRHRERCDSNRRNQKYLAPDGKQRSGEPGGGLPALEPTGLILGNRLPHRRAIHCLTAESIDERKTAGNPRASVAKR